MAKSALNAVRPKHFTVRQPPFYHVALGCELDCVPAELAFGMMNNIAYAYEMKPILLYSGFLGTFGEYDQRSVEGNRVGRL